MDKLKTIPALWLLIVILLVCDAAGLLVQGMSVAPKVLLSTFIASACTGVLAWFYTRIRPVVRIATLAETTSAVLIFMAAGAVLSYLGVTLRQPLIDSYLVGVDHAIGFDWPAMHNWVVSRPQLYFILKLAYASSVPQMVVLLLVLNFRGDIARNWEFLWLLVISGLTSTLISVLWPAMGAYGYFHIEAEQPYVQAFMALREGTIKVIGQSKIQGVVQFPSFHLALAIIYTYAARGIRFLFPLFVVLNILVIGATPVAGGHHLADLLAGTALTVATILFVRHFRLGQKRT